jgi:hypothetical protein
LQEFFEAFRTMESARRDPEKGEVASKPVLEKMQTWAEDVW